MRRVITLSLIFLLCLTVQGKRIRVVTPGTLPSLIGSKKYDIEKLRVTGALNGTDLRFLREMMWSVAGKESGQGRLRSLDLRDVTFDTGGESYITVKDVAYNVTGKYTLPKYLFWNSNLESVVLPSRLDTIDTAAFAFSALRTLTIPEGCVLNAWCIYQMSRLESITFPSYLPEVWYNFQDCPRLTALHFGDVSYIPAECLSGISAVEEISFGNISHIDGWNTISQCPKLRKVDFNGHVVSTGGTQMFADNPQLSSVVFHKSVYSNNIGDAPGCPLLKEYITEDWVFDTRKGEAGSLTLPKTPDSVIEASPKRYFELLDAFKAVKPGTYGSKDDLAEDEGARYMKMMFKTGKEEEAVRKYVALIDKGINRGWQNLVADTAQLRFMNEAASRHPELASALDKLEKENSNLYVLRQAAPYGKDSLVHPAFTYLMEGDTLLAQIRDTLRLDSIAGDGDDISRIKNVMYWLHDIVPHDGSNGIPDGPQDAVSLINACKAAHRGINCRGMAKILTQCYLALGYPARFLTCQPRFFKQDSDCHVITMVWSRSLHKWVWMDASFAAYVTDEDGLLLHPGEVRERLIDGRPLVLNKDANWNHKRIYTKALYLDSYMAKNLYLMSAHCVNGMRTENGGYPGDTEVTLVPTGFTYSGKADSETCDPDYFWQSPVRQ